MKPHKKRKDLLKFVGSPLTCSNQSLHMQRKCHKSEKRTPIIFNGVMPPGVTSLGRNSFLLCLFLCFSSYFSPMSFILDIFTLLPIHRKKIPVSNVIFGNIVRCVLLCVIQLSFQTGGATRILRYSLYIVCVTELSQFTVFCIHVLLFYSSL